MIKYRIIESAASTKPWNENYKGFKIRLDNKNNCYNIYDEHDELEDFGFRSIKDAKTAVDELIADVQ